MVPGVPEPFSMTQLDNLLRDLGSLVVSEAEEPRKVKPQLAITRFIGAEVLTTTATPPPSSAALEPPPGKYPTSWGAEVLAPPPQKEEKQQQQQQQQHRPTPPLPALMVEDTWTPPLSVSPPLSPGVERERAPKGAPSVEPTKFRTKLCKNWAAGLMCPFGERCAFAHGDHQIRKTDDPNGFFEVYSPKQKQHHHHKLCLTPSSSLTSSTPASLPSPSPWGSGAFTVEHEQTFVDHSGCVWYS